MSAFIEYKSIHLTLIIYFNPFLILFLTFWLFSLFSLFFIPIMDFFHFNHHHLLRLIMNFILYYLNMNMIKNFIIHIFILFFAFLLINEQFK